MEIQFRRSGERRYAVKILRPGLPVLEKDPAPGYDDLLPHDLVHLAVERALGLRRGIFGQVAAGGTAGTFFPVESDARTAREASRQRRELARRSGKLMQAGREDSADSEAGTYLARMAWEARRAERACAKAGPQGATKSSTLMAATRTGPSTVEQLEHICSELDLLSARWATLAVGEFLTVRWVGTCAR
jgi:hypothetical protein